MKTSEYQILSHGSMYSDYFQGCGVYGTNFEHVVTGAGCTEMEAFEDALELIASNGVEISPELEKEGESAGTEESYCDADESNDGVYFYVSIRYNVEN